MIEWRLYFLCTVEKGVESEASWFGPVSVEGLIESIDMFSEESFVFDVYSESISVGLFLLLVPDGACIDEWISDD